MQDIYSPFAGHILTRSLTPRAAHSQYAKRVEAHAHAGALRRRTMRAP